MRRKQNYGRNERWAKTGSSNWRYSSSNLKIRESKIWQHHVQHSGGKKLKKSNEGEVILHPTCYEDKRVEDLTTSCPRICGDTKIKNFNERSLLFYQIIWLIKGRILLTTFYVRTKGLCHSKDIYSYDVRKHLNNNKKANF